MPRYAIRLLPAMLLLLVVMLLAGCGNDALPRPEVSAHGTWTFGMSKSL